jgi:predicted homoserine dehydrogenase-like protein
VAGDCLPMGLAEGCRLKSPVPRDQPIRYRDVVLPEGRLSDALRREQAKHFGLAPAGSATTEPLAAPRQTG